MSQQNGDEAAAAAAASNDAHLVVVIGHTASSDDVKLTLSQLNASLNQIGKPVQEHLVDIVNAIRHKQFEKANYDQQQRIGYSNDVNFTFELLVNPMLRSVRQSFKNVATSARKHKFVVNLSSDRASQGDVNCSDASFACDDLITLLADPSELTDEQRKSLKQPQAPKLTLLMPQRVVDANRAWRASLEKQYPGICVQVITTTGPDNTELNEAITPLLNQTPIDQLLHSSKQTGTLKVTRPALYIFPALQGDSAYFALNGYSMLVDGGYDRLKPCFWKFVNMLQQIDSVLVTRADVDALGGLASFFSKKAAEPECKPAVLAVLGNLVHGTAHHRQAAQLIASELATNGHKPSASTPTDVDVIVDAIEKLKIKLMPLVKTNESLLLPFNKSASVHNKYEHINLYSKLGHGSLDLYVLSPYVNSSEYKDFYQQQQHSFAARITSTNVQKSHLAVHGVYKQLPHSHLASSVCLLVWMPTAVTASNNALRLLFTGNAPQHVILNALDKVKDLEILAEPVYRVKPETLTQHHHAPIKKQVSAASGVGGDKAKEPAAANGKLNTSISSKPVGTANGHHEAAASKPPAPTASAGKPHEKKPATTAVSKDTTAAASSLSAPTASSAAKHEAAKKPPAPTPATSTAAAPSGKKKSLAGEQHETAAEKAAEKPAVAAAEKAGEKKKPAVPKKETPTANGGQAKPSQSETSTANTAAPARSSLSSHAVASSSDKKPESKPPVPKQQPKPAASKPEKPEKTDKTEKTAPKPEASKKPAASKPAPTAAKKPAASGPKTLTLSMSTGEGAVVKGGAASAAVATESSSSSAQQQPLIDLGPQPPASVESVETAMHHEESPAKHNGGTDVVVQHVEQVEHVEKIEQVVSVEQVVEQIVSPPLPDELPQQPHHENGSSSNHFGHESPNLSPVKKEFGALNHSHVHHEEALGGVAAVEAAVEDAPVVEEQLTSEVVTTAEIEIVSGNLNGDASSADPELLLARAADDVMTRSFIEDGPGSNPFADPTAGGTNGEAAASATAATPTNGHQHLDESCDLNRTHELFEGDESSSSITQPTGTNGGDVDDKLITGLESLKLANQVSAADRFDQPGMPGTWTLLELPPPVNPADNVVDVAHVDVAHASDKMELDTKPDMTSSPAGTGGPSALAGSDKKAGSNLTNGKAKSGGGRASVEPTSKQATGQSAATGANAKPERQKPVHAAYVELSYIPAHGSEHHVDVEFFKRVRARHYVLSALEPSEHVLNALCEGKETWDDKQLQVTVIPTYESETLRKWYMQNEDRLAQLKIDVSPAACHATITMEDNPELTCQVYKLEF